MSTGFIQLYESERDVILAALRLWQQVNAGIPDEITEIAKNGRDDVLSHERIDKLCQELNFIPEGSDRCPECGDEQIEGGHVEIEEDCATQRCYCTACSAEWIDAYGLFDRTKLR